MLTHDYVIKKEYLLLQVQLIGNGKVTPWFVVNPISNSLKNGPVFDDSDDFKLKDQTWINSIIIKGNKPTEEKEPNVSKIDQIRAGKVLPNISVLFEDDKCIAFRDESEMDR